MTRAEVSQFTAESIDERLSVWGEDVTISGTVVFALCSEQIQEQEIGEGGFRDIARMNVSVRLADMPSPPKVGMDVIARSRSWRVFNVAANLYTYEISVESPLK